jgi:hypothetical protein
LTATKKPAALQQVESPYFSCKPSVEKVFAAALRVLIKQILSHYHGLSEDAAKQRASHDVRDRPYLSRDTFVKFLEDFDVVPDLLNISKAATVG